MMKNLGIVIVNWNSIKELKRCLETIESAGFIGNVVVVDNGTNPKSDPSTSLRTRFRNPKSEIKLIKNKENLGYGGGNNAGIKYFLDKKVRYIFILNPDTEIYKDTIPNLLKILEENKDVGIAGPKIYSGFAEHLGGVHTHTIRGVLPLIWSAGGVIEKNRYSAGLIGNGEIDKGKHDNFDTPSRSPFGHLEGGIQTDYISGTAMMVGREVFDKIGLFEPSYFMYYEDVEFCLKAKKAGFKVMFVPASEIMHHESSTIGKNSPRQEYYMARNHLLFAERNAPISVKIREFIRLPKTIYDHWQRGEYYALLGIRDYFMRRFGQHSP